MGDREDLVHGMRQVEDLQERWQKRRLELEQKLDESWARLKTLQLEDDNRTEKDTHAVYDQIARLDRSLSFLDRALMHLDDIERGEDVAMDVPLRPGSTTKEHDRPQERPGGRR